MKQLRVVLVFIVKQVDGGGDGGRCEELVGVVVGRWVELRAECACCQVSHI